MCATEYLEKQGLTLHLKNYHQEGQRNFKCDACQNSFTESGSLKKHTKTIHDGQRNYKCDSCGKFFTQSGHLKNHITTIHDGQRNY